MIHIREVVFISIICETTQSSKQMVLKLWDEVLSNHNETLVEYTVIKIPTLIAGSSPCSLNHAVRSSLAW
jgi:hypothetical protein